MVSREIKSLRSKERWRTDTESESESEISSNDQSTEACSLSRPASHVGAPASSPSNPIRHGRRSVGWGGTGQQILSISIYSFVTTSLRCRRGPTPTGGSTPPRKFVRRGGHSLNRQRNGFARRVHRNHPVLPRQDSTGIRLGSPTPNVVQIGNFLTRQFIRKMTSKCRHHQLPKYYP